MSISGDISQLRLSSKALGLNICAAKQVHKNYKLTVYRILKTSINHDALNFFNLTINRNADTNLPTNKLKKVCETTLKKKE